jgi:hydrogenase maturation protease
MKLLVAGIGNIFLSDDGFGPEVLSRLRGYPVPPDVEVADYGIRGVHLAYRLLDGVGTLVFVDAAPHGKTPGTVSLLEVDRSEIPVAEGSSPPVDAHGMDPVSVLRMLGSLGGSVERVLVIACEPKVVEEGLGLSPEVEAAVPAAVALIEELLAKQLTEVST